MSGEEILDLVHSTQFTDHVYKYNLHKNGHIRRYISKGLIKSRSKNRGRELNKIFAVL